MGHGTRHPILQRLTQALDAAIPGSSRADLPGQVETDDEAALRDWVLRHHGQYGLDPIWILTGIGQPPLAGNRAATGVAPVFAMSPIDPQTGRWRPMVVERIALAPSILSPTRFVVRMDARTMEPRIRQGAYLVVDTEQVGIPEKSGSCPDRTDQARIFAVDLAGEGLVVRLVQREMRLGRLELTGLVPAVPPQFVSPESEIRVVGRVVWVAQTL
jgi:hypothetical protein